MGDARGCDGGVAVGGIAYCCGAGCRHPALAHSWYPVACCGNMDCFPVVCDHLMETGSGWFYVPTSNLFKHEQVQPSQDQPLPSMPRARPRTPLDLRVHRAECVAGGRPLV
jgi:hypothetical protein